MTAMQTGRSAVNRIGVVVVGVPERSFICRTSVSIRKDNAAGFAAVLQEADH
jgi:hypothetical protein